jgi:hypothetical protein
VITRGCSGYLRQEFREQEILDDITRLKYEGQLPDDMNGVLRNPLIRQYQKIKGTNYVPTMTDAVLRWNSEDPLPLIDAINDSPWKIVDKFKNKNKNKNSDSREVQLQSNYVPAKGSLKLS